MTRAKSNRNSLRELTVGIIGLGQIGGSLAAAFHSCSEHGAVIGFDIEPGLVKTALARGVIDRTAENVAGLIDCSQVVVLATHHPVTLQLMQEHSDRLGDKLLVTDTGSLKQEVMEMARELSLTNFVGGHPIAGSERKGAHAWDAGLFDRAVYVLTAGGSTRESCLDLFREMIGLIGGRPVGVDPREHDRIFALTIGLPHVLAFTLSSLLKTESADQTNALKITGPSWQGTTRVAASDIDFVEQMLWNNRQHLTPRIDDLIERLERFREDLSANDESSMRGRLVEGSIRPAAAEEAD